MTTGTRRDADKALWDALEERRESLRDRSYGRGAPSSSTGSSRPPTRRSADRSLAAAMERRARAWAVIPFTWRDGEGGQARPTLGADPAWSAKSPGAAGSGGLSFARAPRERSRTRRTGRSGTDPSHIERGR